MRPDEHKKKKNAQYKKKHNIPAQGPSKEEKKTKPQQTHRDDVDTSEPRTADTNKEGGAAHSEEKKTFSRRKVTSNWDRYEGGPEESTASKRGEDFEALLAATTGAISQFRLEDEHNWDNVTTATSGDEKEDDDPLSIDLANLEDAMRCIPLPVRLGLENASAIYTSEELKMFEDEAGMFLVEYSRETEEHKAAPNIHDNLTDCTTSDAHSITVPTPVDSGNPLDDILGPPIRGASDNNLVSAAVTNHMVVMPDIIVAPDRDLELDELLGLEANINGVKTTCGDSVRSSRTVEAAMADDRSADVTDEGLEDWLDSVLDC